MSERMSRSKGGEAGKSGGVYVPPFKLAQMMKDVEDKGSLEYQRMSWDALRKSINGLVNKVNSSNIKNILPELFSENLIRGRGLFSRSVMKSQMASPAFTHVFAALVAVVNTKFPELGELLLKRIIMQFRRAFKRNDKPLLLAASKFIAHLVNQQVAHEVVALEVLMILLENPTDDSVEVSVGFVKECGAILQDVAPQGLHGIFERFRAILHEGEIDKRVQFMIEGLFAIRKAGFQGHPAVIPELDLVEQEDQITHEISIVNELDQETGLDVFAPDPNFLENEKKYEKIKKDILGEESEEDDDDEKASDDDDDEDDGDEEEDEEDDEDQMQIDDQTETNLINLRRTIYLTIMSSVDFEEAGHKLLKIKLEPGQEMELCVMLLECCSQERTYLRYYGLLAQRFCMLNRVYHENFDQCFVKHYSTIHRLETNKLRNIAKFYAHLVGTDALPWNVLGYIRLTEEDTTSSSRIFIKILFQELSEHLGIRKLNERLSDPSMQDSFEGIFPKDNPKNTRFAINFFTSIGLGGLTDGLREYLKNMPRLIMQQQQKAIESGSEGNESSSESSHSSSSSSSSTSSDSESDSETESEAPEDSARKKSGRRRREIKETDISRNEREKRGRPKREDSETESEDSDDVRRKNGHSKGRPKPLSRKREDSETESEDLGDARRKNGYKRERPKGESRKREDSETESEDLRKNGYKREKPKSESRKRDDSETESEDLRKSGYESQRPKVESRKREDSETESEDLRKNRYEGERPKLESHKRQDSEREIEDLRKKGYKRERSKAESHKREDFKMESEDLRKDRYNRERPKVESRKREDSETESDDLRKNEYSRERPKVDSHKRKDSKIESEDLRKDRYSREKPKSESRKREDSETESEDLRKNEYKRERPKPESHKREDFKMESEDLRKDRYNRERLKLESRKREDSETESEDLRKNDYKRERPKAEPRRREDSEMENEYLRKNEYKRERPKLESRRREDSETESEDLDDVRRKHGHSRGRPKPVSRKRDDSETESEDLDDARRKNGYNRGRSKPETHRREDSETESDDLRKNEYKRGRPMPESRRRQDSDDERSKKRSRR